MYVCMYECMYPGNLFDLSDYLRDIYLNVVTV